MSDSVKSGSTTIKFENEFIQEIEALKYFGGCHCQAIELEFDSPIIVDGVRCNCSYCKRKGAVMTSFVVPSGNLQINDEQHLLGTYSFGEQLSKQHYCTRCGIYTFHEARSNPGSFRINIGCVENIDIYDIPCSIFNGKAL